MKAAQARADDMALTGSFSHKVATTSPVTNWTFMDNSGYKRLYSGENLATLFENATDTVNAWKASNSHNENLLNKNYKEIGVAIIPAVYEGKNTFHVVQFFGSQPENKKESKKEEKKTAKSPDKAAIPKFKALQNFPNKPTTSMSTPIASNRLKL